MSHFRKYAGGWTAQVGDVVAFKDVAPCDGTVADVSDHERVTLTTGATFFRSLLYLVRRAHESIPTADEPLPGWHEGETWQGHGWLRVVADTRAMLYVASSDFAWAVLHGNIMAGLDKYGSAASLRAAMMAAEEAAGLRQPNVPVAELAAATAREIAAAMNTDPRNAGTHYSHASGGMTGGAGGSRSADLPAQCRKPMAVGSYFVECNLPMHDTLTPCSFTFAHPYAPNGSMAQITAGHAGIVDALTKHEAGIPRDLAPLGHGAVKTEWAKELACPACAGEPMCWHDERCPRRGTEVRVAAFVPVSFPAPFALAPERWYIDAKGEQRTVAEGTDGPPAVDASAWPRASLLPIRETQRETEARARRHPVGLLSATGDYDACRNGWTHSPDLDGPPRTLPPDPWDGPVSLYVARACPRCGQTGCLHPRIA